MMKIVIVGAGAIGSLYGAMLSKKNMVELVGRRQHINAIQHNGLTIEGKTHLHVKISAVESIDNITISPDIVLLTVKSCDTEVAGKQILPIMQNNTKIISLQNGLDNIEKIEQFIDKSNIIAGVTMQAAILSKPGNIIHTGTGETILGELDGHLSKRLETIIRTFNESKIETKKSDEILKQIWIKTIINSSINPITAFLRCKNGYLLQNPILEKIVERVCIESTQIASLEGIQITPKDMIIKTREVIQNTKQNYSSMLQSIQQGKKTEIDSINGKLAKIGKKHKIDATFNRILTDLISSLN